MRNPSNILRYLRHVAGAVAVAAVLVLFSAAIVRADHSAPDAPSVVNNVSGSSAYRSFEPDSLIVRNATKRKVIGSGWCAVFENQTGELVLSLEISFEKAVVLTSYAPFPDVFTSDGGKTWVISGQLLGPGATVTICGTGPKEGTLITRWRWASFEPMPYQSGFVPEGQVPLLAMPNTANLRMEVYMYGGFAPNTSESDILGGMVVGTSFTRLIRGNWKVDPDSARKYGWVRLKRHNDVQKSLMPGRSGIKHDGVPRGFCILDNGKPFVKQHNNLPPVKMSNRLFAELLALKMNIAASTLGITPPGFGELVYDDDGHPFDEFPILQIAERADSFMTYCSGRGLDQYEMVDTVLRKINAAFSGPVDTLSFGDSLVFAPVRSVDDVPFLKVNPNAQVRILPRVYHPEFDSDDEDEFSDEAEASDIVLRTQNFPNPFNPSTTIRFELRSDAVVTVRVFDVLGQEVAVLVENEISWEGWNEIHFDADRLASGVYFYLISGLSLDEASSPFRSIGKMILLR